MALVAAVHHIATATNDLDRFLAFYSEALELEPDPGFPMDTPVGRIAFFGLEGVQIQVVESGTITPAPADSPAILLQQNLRLDHYTLRIDTKDAFDKARAALVRLGASTGEVQDFRGSDLLAFTDPDAHTTEIIYLSAAPAE